MQRSTTTLTAPQTAKPHRATCDDAVHLLASEQTARRRPATIVIARRIGRLGNRLILSSHFMAFAREHGARVLNPAFAEYGRYFEGTRHDLLCAYPRRSIAAPAWPWLRRLVSGMYYYPTRALVGAGCKNVPLKIVRLTTGQRCELTSDAWLGWVRQRRYVFVLGWDFRDAAAVRRQAAAIRAYFQPVEEHQRAIAAVIRRARGEGDVLVGLHIRQGDYARYMQGRYFYSPEQYCAITRQIVELFAPRKVSFFVCSDAPQRPENFPGLAVTLGTGHVVEDMYALSRCDYLIGPPSTFTGWASFYGDVPLCPLEIPNQPIRLEDFRVNF
jgi:hypothetical protein